MIAGAHAQTTASNAQMVQQRNAQVAQDNEIAKRRAKKPTDKNIPEGVEDIAIGDGVQQYKQLREVERRLDAMMMRKRLEIHDSRPQNHDRTGTLRIWISNTAENQPWQGRDLDENAFDFSTGIEATYKVKIEGRLLDEADDEFRDDDEEEKQEEEDKDVAYDGDAMDHDGKKDKQAKSSKPVQARRKLSHFFKSITVEFDRNKNLQPDGITAVEWKKPSVPPNTSVPPREADFDSIEFERKSDENIHCSINLQRDEFPERYALSKELAEVLDTEEETRAGIVMGIWEYVKAMDLQQDDEKRLIQCDDRLRAVS